VEPSPLDSLGAADRPQFTAETAAARYAELAAARSA
jgi:hypothetical protein